MRVSRSSSVLVVFGLLTFWESGAQASSTIDLARPTPGTPDRLNSIVVDGVEPFAWVDLVQGVPGEVSVLKNCDGVVELTEGEVVAQGQADAQGTVVVELAVPADRAGDTVALQVRAPGDCAVSGVLVHTWQIHSFEGIWSAEVADAKVLGEAAGDILGCRVDASGDGDGDGLADLAIGAARSDRQGHDAGIAYVMYGARHGELAADTEADLTLVGEGPGDFSGWALSWVGDLDGDGNDDLMVGARYSPRGGEGAGAAYVFLMPRTGTVNLADADAILVGEAAGDEAGRFVTGAGDLDGDGFGDVVVSAPYHDGPGGIDSGAVYVVHGPISGVWSLAEADAKLVGEAPGDEAGQRVEVTDSVFGSLVVAAHTNDRGGENAGAVYVVDGPLQGLSSLSTTASLILTGDRPHAGLGIGLTVADIHDDGHFDLLLATGCSDRGHTDEVELCPDDAELTAGRLHIVPGPLTGEHSVADVTSATVVGHFEGGFAAAHTATCDFDGDGDLELAVAAHHAGVERHAGEVYLMDPQRVGTWSVLDAETVFTGLPGDNLGQDVSCADLDGDGLGDLVLGAEAADHDYGGEGSGAAFVYYGRPLDPLTPGTSSVDDEEPAESTTAPPGSAPRGCNTGGAAPTVGAALLALWGLGRRRSGRSIVMAATLASTMACGMGGPERAPAAPDAPKAPNAPKRRAPSSDQLMRFSVDAEAYPKAVCNDGTTPVFYMRRGSEPDKWVVWLKGGGACYDAATCAASSLTLTSSDPWMRIDSLSDSGNAESTDGKAGGILSADPSTNPDFNTWNHVYLVYCTSDWWTGTRSASKETYGMNFTGALVADAMLAALKDPDIVGEPSLAEASHLVMSGSSAGTMGMRGHIDTWSEGLRGVDVRGFSDSNILPEVIPGRTDGDADGMSLRYTLWGSRADASCAKATPQAERWNCIRGRYLLEGGYLSTPVFWRMDQRDPVMLGHAFDRKDPAHRRQARESARLIREAMAKADGGFCPASGKHIVLNNSSEFNAPAIDGHSAAEVFGNWYFDRAGPKLLVDPGDEPARGKRDKR